MAQFIGADLGSMSMLSTEFKNFGDGSATFITQVVQQLQVAEEQFTASMSQLRTEADANSADMKAFISAVTQRFAGTSWTGENRRKVEAFQATWEQHVNENLTQINAYLTECKAVVDGALRSDLNEMVRSCTEYSSKASESANSFSKAVESQRNAFDRAMNG